MGLQQQQQQPFLLLTDACYLLVSDNRIMIRAKLFPEISFLEALLLTALKTNRLSDWVKLESSY